MFCTSYEYWGIPACLPLVVPAIRIPGPWSQITYSAPLCILANFCMIWMNHSNLCGSCFLSGCCHTRMRCHRAVTADAGWIRMGGVWWGVRECRAPQRWSRPAGFTEGMYVKPAALASQPLWGKMNLLDNLRVPTNICILFNAGYFFLPPQDCRNDKHNIGFTCLLKK